MRHLLSLVLALAVHHACGSKTPPNVLILFVDDLGWGDLGVQGNDTIVSPNIDKLANEGVRFTQWLSGSSICTPSRGALLTGRLPVRLGLASSNYQTRVFSPISPAGLPHSELTLAEALKERGYQTHMTGKWHLGIGENGKFLPTNHGFDEYYGMGVTNVMSCKPGKHIHQQDTVAHFVFDNTRKVWASLSTIVVSLYFFGFKRLAKVLVFLGVLLFAAIHHYACYYTLMNPENCLLYRDTEIIQQPINLFNLTQRHTADAQRFLVSAMQKEEPWFLYMSYAKVHTALFNNPEFNNVGKNEYVDNVAELDWSVGELMKTIAPVRDNTIIWFSSDNGPFLERGTEGGGAGALRGAPFRGGKGQVWEGGIRVPGIVSFTGSFPQGKVTEEPMSTMDIFPTTLALVDNGLKLKLGTKLTQPRGPLDGKNNLDLIYNAGTPKEASRHKAMFHYCGEELAAIRIDGRYKAIFATPIWEDGLNNCPTQSMCSCEGDAVIKHQPPLLFDVREDPSESVELTPDTFSEYENVMKSVTDSLKEHVHTFLKSPNQENQLEIFGDPFLLPCCGHPGRPSLMQLFTRDCKCDRDTPIEIE